jgi:hypothetical protein
VDPIREIDKGETGEAAVKAAQQAWLYWQTQISCAERLEKDFRSTGDKLCQLFEGQKKKTHQFNILYSNTETLAPALYNATPRPVVRPRERRPAPLASLAAAAGEGILTYLLDDGSPRAENFSSAMKAAVYAALVPGRGVTWVTYDPLIKRVTQHSKEGEGDGGSKEQVEEVIEAEYICQEDIPWDEFLHGFARSWKHVPWVARIRYFTREDAKRLFPSELAAKLQYSEPDRDSSKDDERRREEKPQGIATAKVYQIWDKSRRKVLYWSESFKDGLLSEEDDPYGLSGFFPCPMPLRFVERMSNLTPVALYTMYEEQAEELNALTLRINRLVRALKIRGGYDSTLGQLKSILEAEDNTLIPLSNVSALSGSGQTLDKAIWLMPIQDIITVLQQLYVQREQCKNVIYEIMGVSDIIRGASVASETATAQSIKDKWTGVRIKRPQQTVQAYVRDCLRLTLELAITKLDDEQLWKMSGLDVMREAEKQQQMTLLQHQMSMAQDQEQAAPLMQQLQELQSSPTFDTAMQLLRDDLQRSYIVDIETNSTIDSEATEDKQDITELLGGLGQFLTSVGPLVQAQVLPMEAAQAMMLAISRRFRFGREVEEYIRGMKPPPQQANLEIEKQLKEIEKGKQELEEKSMELDFETKKAKIELEFERKLFDFQKQIAEQEAALKKQADEMAMKLKAQQMSNNIAAKAQQGKMQVQQARQRAVAGGAPSGASAGPAPPAPPQDDGGGQEELVQAVLVGMESVGKQIAAAVAQAVAAPRTGRAVKLEDGSWAMQAGPQPPLQ